MLKKRSVLKRNARMHLTGKYGTALLVAVIASLIQNALSIARSAVINWIPSLKLFSSFPDIMTTEAVTRLDFDSWVAAFRALIDKIGANARFYIFFFVISFLIEFLFSLLISNVIVCGMQRWFLRADYPQWTPTIGMMFTPFSSGQYRPVVVGMFWKNFWIFLWSLPQFVFAFFLSAPTLLLIYHVLMSGSAITPGFIRRVASLYGLPEFFFQWPWLVSMLVLLLVSVIALINRAYRYRMTEIILADNPSIGMRRALDLSKKMTKRFVWKMFFLDVSFIGWAILCMLFYFVSWLGFLLLMPYYTATWIEAYRELRDEAVRRGEVTMEELGYRRIEPAKVDADAFFTS
ncbi:MAG: DUF975 family protein [Clostridiaceae bacterium]|jgi:uncharacterized membrane protein|nr:DUF975 family protein [Clostridiaceae bacterium]